MDLERIRAKLDEVRRSGKRCFGSETHKFLLGARCTQKEVAGFEKARKVSLPEDYRAFVLGLGASGAGPFYGLLPLSRWKAGLHHAKKLKLRALTLGDQGCNNYGLLVLEGEQRGRVVYVSDQGTAYYPEHADFISWYERWLDEILWNYDSIWFGTGMPGRELDFLAALRDDSVDQRIRGAAAMLRLPHLSAESRDALLALLGADEARVLTVAIPVLAKLDAPALESHLPALLEHPDRNVLNAALNALPDSKHAPLAKKHVGSKDKAIAGTAMRSVTLSETELVAMLDGPNWEDAMMALRERGDGAATPHLIAMIEETSFERRRAALVCLRSRKEASARDALLAHFPHEKEQQLRQEIVEGLGAMGDFDSVLAFASHDEPALRFRAVFVLGQLGDKRAIPALQALALDDTKPRGAAWSMAEQVTRALAKLQ